MKQLKKISIEFLPGFFTVLSDELLALVDAGECISVHKFLKMCEDYTIMSWLKEKIKMYELWGNDEKIILAEELASLANVISPEDDYSIRNNGILVLIAFCQALINEKPTRTRKDCDDAEDALSKLGLL